MERGLRPVCAQRPGLCRSKELPSPFDPEPSLVSPGEGAAGPREGGPAAGSHGEGTRRRGNHLECRLLPMSNLICDKERQRE
jgi:hypothetical protein